ncbi:MAG: PepSY domain-containing protein [Candidatus Xenobiia bacterium LiM19]
MRGFSEFLRTVLICIAFTLLLPSFSAAKEGDFTITVTPDRTAYGTGQSVVLQVHLKNNSGKSALFVRPQEGSEQKLRYPYCLFEITSSKGILVAQRRPDCKVTAPLEPSAFFELKPNESKALYDKGYRIELSSPLEPGTYRVLVRYSTEAQKESQWYGLYSDDYWREIGKNDFWKKRANDMKRNRDMLAGVPAISIVSKTVEIKVVKSMSVSREEAMKIAEKTCREKGWPWEKPHVFETDAFYDIQTNWGQMGRNAFIRIDKKTGAVLDSHMTGP